MHVRLARPEEAQTLWNIHPRKIGAFIIDRGLLA